MGIEDEDATPREPSRDPTQGSPAEQSGQDPGLIEPAAVEMPLVSVGAMLREAREQQNLSVVEISERLRLTEHYVRALESGDYEKLPGEVYVKGYMKSYALLLGLEVGQVLAAYRHSGAPEAYEISHEPIVPERSSRLWVVLLLFAVVGGAVAAAGWWIFQAFTAGFLPVVAVKIKKGRLEL